MTTHTIRDALYTLEQAANRGTAVYVSSAIVQELREALEAEPETDPIRKHCIEILELWDADCDIGMAMEHLRGMLAGPKQSTEIQQP